MRVMSSVIYLDRSSITARKVYEAGQGILDLTPLLQSNVRQFS
jgi:hypothetical protein